MIMTVVIEDITLENNHILSVRVSGSPYFNTLNVVLPSHVDYPNDIIAYIHLQGILKGKTIASPSKAGMENSIKSTISAEYAEYKARLSAYTKYDFSESNGRVIVRHRVSSTVTLSYYIDDSTANDVRTISYLWAVSGSGRDLKDHLTNFFTLTIR